MYRKIKKNPKYTIQKKKSHTVVSSRLNSCNGNGEHAAA
jgi:hypothetical protein